MRSKADGRADGRVPLRRLLDRGTVEALFAAALTTAPDGLLALVDPDGTVVVGDLEPSAALRARMGRALDGPQGAPVAVAHGRWLCPVHVDGRAVAGILVGGALVGPEGGGPMVDILRRSLSAMFAQAIEIRVLGQETLDRYREINLLYRVGETIGASLDAAEIPRLLLSEASRAIRSDAACVLMGPGRTVEASTGATRLVEATLEASRALVEDVIADGQPVLVSPGAEAASVGSLLVVPIRARDERVGAVVLARESGGRALTAGDEKLLLAVAGEAGVAYDRARLHEQELGRQRLDEELAVGRRIQLSLLPGTTPTAPGWGFAAVYEAAREVGGDLYDFLEARRAQGTLDVVIGDVTGKGVPAALVMALTRAMVRASADGASTPSEVLHRTNHHLIHDGRAGLFVTALYVSLDLERGDVVLANGGHDAPLLVSGPMHRTRLVTSPSAILGMFRELDIEDRRVHLDPGDVLVLYTDGVTEARDPQRRLFGERRLRAVAAANASRDASAIAEAIVGEVRGFSRGLPMADDLTLVVIKREAS
jgi:serine phosphatase RsbU (regulator of sigma subunit)